MPARILVLLWLVLCAFSNVAMADQGGQTDQEGRDGAWSAPIAKPTGRFARQVRVLDEPLPVPDYAFEERKADGSRRDWAMVDFRGRVVLLNFWATWCGVCAKELPKLDGLSATMRVDGIDIVALSLDDEIGQAAATLMKRGHRSLRVFHDTQSVLSALLGVRGVPTTFIVGPDGRAIAVVQGPADWESPEALAWLRGLVPAPASTLSRDSSSRGSPRRRQ